jgi:hypothetical protein
MMNYTISSTNCKRIDEVQEKREQKRTEGKSREIGRKLISSYEFE